MEVLVEQRIDADRAAVIAAFCDRSFYGRLGDLAAVDRPEVVDLAATDGRCRIRLRYRYTGHLPPGADRFVHRARLTWVEDSELDRATGDGSFVIVPDHYPNLLRASGTVSVAGSNPCLRTVAGRLEVDLGLFGRPLRAPVERAIVGGLERALREQVPHVEDHARST